MSATVGSSEAGRSGVHGRRHAVRAATTRNAPGPAMCVATTRVPAWRSVRAGPSVSRGRRRAPSRPRYPTPDAPGGRGCGGRRRGAERVVASCDLTTRWPTRWPGASWTTTPGATSSPSVNTPSVPSRSSASTARAAACRRGASGRHRARRRHHRCARQHGLQGVGPGAREEAADVVVVEVREHDEVDVVDRCPRRPRGPPEGRSGCRRTARAASSAPEPGVDENRRPARRRSSAFIGDHILSGKPGPDPLPRVDRGADLEQVDAPAAGGRDRAAVAHGRSIPANVVSTAPARRPEVGADDDDPRPAPDPRARGGRAERPDPPAATPAAEARRITSFATSSTAGSPGRTPSESARSPGPTST